MADTATPKTAAKTAKSAAEKTSAFALPTPDFAAFEMPKLTFPKFDANAFPQMEIPAPFREAAEKATQQFKAGFDKLKTVAEETTDVMEDTFETARAGATELNLKTLDALKANSDAVFAFARTLFSAKTFAEVVELQTAFAKSQFETLTAQTKDFQAAAKKVAEETAEPVKTAVSKTFKDLKAA